MFYFASLFLPSPPPSKQADDSCERRVLRPAFRVYLHPYPAKFRREHRKFDDGST